MSERLSPISEFDAEPDGREWLGKPRGKDMMLPHGGLPEVISPYLLKLIAETGGPTGPIGLQFIAQPNEEQEHYEGGTLDPLIEDAHRVSESAVVKYEPQYNEAGELDAYGRMLWLVTLRCGTYCRYCTRGREVGTAAAISRAEMDKVLEYLQTHDDINEVILSGGDPMTVPIKAFEYLMAELGQLQRQEKLDVIRIGTRLIIHNPAAITEAHYEAMKQVENLRIMLHANHPAELTPEVLHVIKRLQRDCHAIISSQTVLLNGVNYFEDAPGAPSWKTLQQLFVKLAKHGIMPYYVFNNDAVYWAKHFTVPIRDAIAMWGELRARLSGDAARARFVIDIENGYGKIAVPEGNAWQVDYEAGFWDFKGNHHQLPE